MQTPPLRTGCAFLPLERPSNFQGAFPGSNVEGKGDHVRLNIFLLNTFSFFLLMPCLIIVSKLCVCSGKWRIVGSAWGKRASEKWRKLQPDRVLLFFLLFFWLEPLFSYTWISGDEIGRVACSWVSSRSLVLVVYVVPGLCSRRRECHSSAAQHGDTHTGATSCPQAAKEAKLCQVAAHPAADAKYPSVFSISVSVETLKLWIIIATRVMDHGIEFRGWKRSFETWTVRCSWLLRRRVWTNRSRKKVFLWLLFFLESTLHWSATMPQLNGGGGDDLGANDEMISFKDEGEQEEKISENVSAERDLDDVKSSLVNESESSSDSEVRTLHTLDSLRLLLDMKRNKI